MFKIIKFICFLFLFLLLGGEGQGTSLYKPGKCIIPREGGARRNWGLPVVWSARSLVRSFARPVAAGAAIHTAHEVISIPRAQRT